MAGLSGSLPGRRLGSLHTCYHIPFDPSTSCTTALRNPPPATDHEHPRQTKSGPHHPTSVLNLIHVCRKKVCLLSGQHRTVQEAQISSLLPMSTVGHHSWLHLLAPQVSLLCLSSTTCTFKWHFAITRFDTFSCGGVLPRNATEQKSP